MTLEMRVGKKKSRTEKLNSDFTHRDVFYLNFSYLLCPPKSSLRRQGLVRPKVLLAIKAV